MATRQRNRPQSSDTGEQEEDFLAYETAFELDNDITEADVEEFLEEQDFAEELKEKKEGFLNLQTGSGLAIIAIGAVYLLQQLGFFGLPFNMAVFVNLLPWLAGIIIVLTGFGVLSWSPSRRRRKARQRARERRQRMEQRRKTVGRETTTASDTRSKAFEAAKQTARRAAREAERVAASTRSRSSQRRAGTRRRLAKSRKHKVVAGVAGGIANYLGIEPVLVRIAFVIGAIMGSGFTIPLYLILAFVLPAADALGEDDDDDDTFVHVIRD